MAILQITSGSTTVSLPDPAQHDYGIFDIDASTSGRNSAGYMKRDVVRNGVRKLSLGWQNITQAQISTILNAINHPSFTVRYYDPKTGTVQTFTGYHGDIAISPYWLPSGTASSWLFSSLTFDLIEV